MGPLIAGKPAQNSKNWQNPVRILRSIVMLFRPRSRKSQAVPDRPVAGASRGHFNTVLLHAAVMNPQIKALALFGPLLSYESIVMNEYYSTENLYAAPGGVMGVYDLPETLTGIPAGRL